MSRKDYVKFAELFRFARSCDYDQETVQRLQEEVANIFAADNPRFDRQRFAKACVPEDQ